MDKARIATIWAELKQYGDETQLGFPLSTIKVGELAELISENAGYADTIERQAKEISNLKKAFADDQDVLGGLLQERDAALAEVERLKAEIGELAGKWAGDMAADLLSGVSTVKD